MKIIIPMAGSGARFMRSGYTEPKPLIKVDNKRIIEYILDMFDKVNDEFIFICNNVHLYTTDMYRILKGLVPNCTIIEINPHRLGPVHTLLESSMSKYIDDNEQVIVSYCDNPYLWDYKYFKDNTKADGYIMSHQGFHPHRLSSTYMAHIKTDSNSNQVLAIKEKEPYTIKPMEEHASTGTYYFKKGTYLKEYCEELIEKNIHYNGEFHLTLVYNLMIRDNLTVEVYPTDFVTVFGTPEELENFKAWQTILKGSQVKSEQDAIMCYNYWKMYARKKGEAIG